MRRHAILGGPAGTQILGDGDLRLLAGDDSLEDLLLAGDGMQGIDEQVRQQAIAQIVAKNGLVMRQQQPTSSRRFPMGFESNGLVAAGTSVTIVSRPQVLFRGERLTVPSDIAGDFVLDDLKIGKNSQLVAEGAIPCRVLQENAVDAEMQLDTAQVSQDISLSVTNIAGADRTFRASLLGRAAE